MRIKRGLVIAGMTASLALMSMAAPANAITPKECSRIGGTPINGTCTTPLEVTDKQCRESGGRIEITDPDTGKAVCQNPGYSGANVI
jgi:hypothetical protein